MSYDPANGNLLSVTDAKGGTRNFTYDETLQLTGGGYVGVRHALMRY